jgi:hypothetical protein
MTGFCSHCDEPSCYIKGGEFLEQLRDHKRLKKDSTPRSEFQWSLESLWCHYIISHTPVNALVGPNCRMDRLREATRTRDISSDTQELNSRSDFAAATCFRSLQSA